MKRNSAGSVFLCAMAAAVLACMSCLCTTGVSYAYSSAGRRDPFVPLVGVSSERSGEGVWGILTIDDVVFQGVTVEPDGARSVIINGEVLREGDEVGRLTVESIGDNVVKIKIGDERFEKKLYEKEYGISGE